VSAVRTGVGIAWPILFVAVIAVVVVWTGAVLSNMPTEGAYVPIGVFALLRWLMWVGRKIPASLYSPTAGRFEATTAVISPVYEEDPVVFRAALESWRRERPTEIIAVVDSTDTACIGIARSYPDVRLLVTRKPGKRAALADGIEAATSEIVVLVDSDTLWRPGLREAILAPFQDPEIGGVGTRQNVYRPRSVWQRIADVYLDLRYIEELPGQTVIGRAVSCLSGRTAAYRRAILLPLLAHFLNDRFLGQPCMAGDDKHLTRLVLRAGYGTYYQSTARVDSTFPAGRSTALRQRLRWARNSFRYDLGAFWDGSIWTTPYLALMTANRLVTPYALLVGLGYFIGALLHAQWAIAAVIGLWWLGSRTVKMLPHLRRRPGDLAIVPAFVVATFVIAFLNIWALVTVHHDKWLTRGVEVRDGAVVHTETATSVSRQAPLTTRLVGIVVAVGLFSLVQLILLGLGGAGYLPSATITVIAVVALLFGGAFLLHGGAGWWLERRRGGAGA
jgi:hyaluronan synthase